MRRLRRTTTLVTTMETETFFPDFSLIEFGLSQKPSRWIILSTNNWKFMWDIFIVFVLVFVAFVVPCRLAFVEVDEPVWIWTYQTIDFMFFVDIILTFFSSV